VHIVSATLLLLFLSTIAVPWARRIGLPTEVFLVLGSLALSLIPGLPQLSLDPTVVFAVFLPPILFSGGFFTSWRDFKNDQHAIGLLAIGLVLFTTVLVAVAVRALGIGIPWAVAFLLGAIVSPPDASAATAITKKLGVPRRLLTIIEGESLVNDATALVAYRVALGAILTGFFSLSDATFRFALMAGGGVVVGLIVARCSLFLLRRLNNSTAETTLMLITSFGTYLCAEYLGVSGVISTVAGGLYFGRKFPGLTAAQSRLEALGFWKTMLFIINGLAFTLIGLQMPAVMNGLQEYSWQKLTICGALVAFVVIAVRFIWVFPVSYLPGRLFPSLFREPAPAWGIVTALSWMGMRGIVSLAAALSIPVRLPSGAEFPFRNLLIFLTYVVILATLLIPATTLPRLMRRLGINDGGEARRDENLARLSLLRAALREIEILKDSSDYSEGLLEDTAAVIKHRFMAIQEGSKAAPSAALDEERDMRQLKQRVLVAERRELERLRYGALIHDAVFFHLNGELDIEETLLRARQI
jgi:Na+/H+ antiporter